MQRFETEFYRIATKKPSRGAGPNWRAKATIFRKDSGERTTSVVMTGTTPEEAESTLAAELSRKLNAMAKPADWGRDAEPPALIASYLQLREQLYALHLQETSNPGYADQIKRDAKALEAARLSELKDRINRLSDNQKLALFKATPEQIADPGNPWNLDDLTAKRELFRLWEDGKPPSLQSAAQEVQNLLNKV